MVVNHDISLVDSTESDEEFSFQIYSSVRREEVAAWGWTGAQQEGFLRMQFLAQRTGYRGQYPDASFLIVRNGMASVGTMIVNRAPDAITLVDISILPEHQGRRIGQTLLEGLRDESSRTRRPIRLSVRNGNRAIRLYARMGFSVIADDGVYQWLELPPS